MGEVFTEQVVMDVSDNVKHIPGAITIVRGRQAVVDQTRGIIAGATNMHHVHGCEITFVSDREAQVIWDMEDWITFPDDIPAPFRSQHAFGFYHETHHLDGSSWRIAALRPARQRKTIVART